MSRLRRVGTLAVPLTTLLLLASCSAMNASHDDDEDEIAVETGGATLDVSQELITWPLDRYSLSVAESDTIQ